jgi:hypothetical protein
MLAVVFIAVRRTDTSDVQTSKLIGVDDLVLGKDNKADAGATKESAKGWSEFHYANRGQ